MSDMTTYRGPLHEYLGRAYPEIDFIVPGHDELWPMIENAHEVLAEDYAERREKETFTLGFGLGALGAAAFLAFVTRRGE